MKADRFLGVAEILAKVWSRSSYNRGGMTLRKLAPSTPEEELQAFCRSQEHNPPAYIVLENGAWEHTCPQCGKKTVFRVERPTWWKT